MNYFLDTNVPTGYTVPHDKWHESSVNFIENTSCPLYWSNLVKEEYNELLESIVDDVEIFLDESKKVLKENQKDFHNYERFERFILRKTKHCKLENYKKVKILEEFWINNNFIEGISEEVHIKFSGFMQNINKLYYKRDSKLNKFMTLHDCGLDNYLKYENYARGLYNAGVHKPDCKIIVDAHDCGLAHDDLIFITNDVEMINAISKINTSHLMIVEFRSCN